MKSFGMLMVGSYPYPQSMSMIQPESHRRRRKRMGGAQILANQNSRSAANKQPEFGKIVEFSQKDWRYF
jgi:hypothetical protein